MYFPITKLCGEHSMSSQSELYMISVASQSQSQTHPTSNLFTQHFNEIHTLVGSAL